MMLMMADMHVIKSWFDKGSGDGGIPNTAQLHPLSSLPPLPSHPASHPRMTSDALTSAQGVAQSAGRGWEPAARRSSQLRSQLFPGLFQRLGKGWGCPFCALWMSRNDGAGGF